MSLSVVGLFAGLLLTLIAAVAGFGWLLLGAVLATAGYLVGAHLEGRVDLAGLATGRRRG